MTIPDHLSKSDKRMLRNEYISRINRVLDYIDKHIAEDLKLDTLAGVANFSSFHFHRVFRTIVGETLYQYIQRVRLERAASTLCQSPYLPIADVAFENGYTDPASFAKAFGAFFGMTASEWRQRNAFDSNSNQTDSKIGKANSNYGKTYAEDSEYFCIEFTDSLKNSWRVQMQTDSKTQPLECKVEIADCPAFTIAYLRHIGPYKGDETLFGRLFGKLMQWAAPRGIMAQPDLKCITIYHDNPDITEDDKQRISVCVSVPADTVTDGEIGKMTIPAGKYAIAHFEISPDRYGDAWNAVYGGWMPESGYQPDDRPCFELYLNDPKQHPEGKHVVDIYAPVKPL